MTAPPSRAPSSVPLCDIDALQNELCEARNAQRTVEIALANEREANVTAGVRAAINDAIRSQWEACSERDRVQRDCKQAQVRLKEAQHAIRTLEYELTRLFLENRLLARENKELAAAKSPIRYSPLIDTPTRYRCHRRHISTTHYQMRAPESACGIPHLTSSSPFASPAGLPDEEALPSPVYDRMSLTPWTYAPPHTVEHSTEG